MAGMERILVVPGGGSDLLAARPPARGPAGGAVGAHVRARPAALTALAAALAHAAGLVQEMPLRAAHQLVARDELRPVLLAQEHLRVEDDRLALLQPRLDLR